eukprot:GEMP01013623.1.p1 GENE.GEMP01013623.1~~GEMP01013623.1.p1  ORF type:complete len:563 (+),score=109.50 GEMP01013623.1:122-1810(+)
MGPKSKIKKDRAPKKRTSVESSNLDEDDFSDDDMKSNLPLDAIVKVFTSHSDPNFCLPWQKHQQQRSSGTGFVISGRPEKDERFVLTNAHCVEHHNQVQVKKRGDDTKFIARVVAMGWQCDLALLQVVDTTFYEGMTPVQFSKNLPNLEDAVLCVGYPLGGDTLSITSGVVSRVEVVDYTQNHAELLGIQIDAAINSGNSGGPAFSKKTEKCVGVAFQALTEAENIGYIIPVVVVEHFLQDLVRNDGIGKGFPTLGIEVQMMENPGLRKACKVDDKNKAHKGVLINRVLKTGCAAGILQPGDVLCAFNDVDIGNDGTTTLRRGERVSFTWSIQKLYHNDEATARILRNGEEVTVSITLQAEFPLVPAHLPAGQTMPTYFIVGGLVFTPLLQPYLVDAYGEEWDSGAPVDISFRASFTYAENRDKQLITLAQVLAHDVTIGYEDLEGGIVEKVNGEKIENMRQLVTRITELRQAAEPFLRFELHNQARIVLETQSLDKAEKEVLADQSIPSIMSVDLLPPKPAERASGSSDSGIHEGDSPTSKNVKVGSPANAEPLTTEPTDA